MFYLEEIGIWSVPRVTTIGAMHSRLTVIANEFTTTGWKSRIFVYTSIGVSVPLVTTTVWNLSKIGLTAIDASRQQSCSSGSATWATHGFVVTSYLIIILLITY